MRFAQSELLLSPFTLITSFIILFSNFASFQKTITHCKYCHQTDAMWRFFSNQRSHHCVFAKEVTCVEMKIVCCQHCTVLLYTTVQYCTPILPYHSYMTSAVVRHNFVLSHGATVLLHTSYGSTVLLHTHYVAHIRQSSNEFTPHL